ncbi:type VI secretion protein, partial [Candidatus Magnetomorum sp. HK-1]
MKNTFRPIYWKEGQLILPQHFQQEYFFLREMFSRISKSMHPYIWGHRSLCIKNIDLNSELFEISGGEFWFENDEMPRRLFTDHDQPGDTIVEIKNIANELQQKPEGNYYICVRLSNNLNVQHLENLDSKLIQEKQILLETRFVSTSNEEDIKNIHDNDKGQLFRLYHALQIVIEESKNVKNKLPIAKISKTKHNIFFHEKYIPPTINLDLEIKQINPLENIILEIQKKLKSYSDYLSPYGINVMNDGEKDDNYRMILVSLNRNIGILHHYLAEKKHIHPWNVFILLKSLITELSTFSRIDNYKIDKILDYIKYDHLDLYLTFNTIKETLTLLLKEISARPEFI